MPYVQNSSLIFAVSQLLPFLAYFYVSHYTTNPQVYIDNLIAKCPPDTITKVFHERAFPYIGKTALGYLAYLGILVHHKYLTSNSTNQRTDLWKSIVRLCLTVVILSPFLW